MNKKHLLPILTIVIVAIAAAIAIPAIIQANQPAPVAETTDIATFKEEYESLNGTTRASDGATYQSITISDDAKVEYLSAAAAADFVKQGTGVLYVGANWCPWCRNAVPELLAAAKAYGNRTVYYVTLDDDKSTYAVQDGQLVQTKAGTADYYQLLDALSARLKDYTITDNDITYDTGEKRIYMPYVVAIKDGQILSDHTGTVTLDADQTKYDSLTTAQSQELFSIYAGMFAEIYGTTCDEHATTPCD